MAVQEDKTDHEDCEHEYVSSSSLVRHVREELPGAGNRSRPRVRSESGESRNRDRITLRRAPGPFDVAESRLPLLFRPQRGAASSAAHIVRLDFVTTRAGDVEYALRG